ncbi:MAG: TonB-dependent receptor plug domain-containing protein [Gemmatimonadaceae bacterium]|nr:TonB-dependent receptor plug domain-containing protein [Gemmatimonadaceae bacterium]
MRASRSLALCIAVIATAAGRALAQNGDTTRVTVIGTVRDSIANAPLVAAVVQLASATDLVHGATFTVDSDSSGAFRIANVPRGDYLATFYHNRLDELGLVAGVRRVRVDGDPATLNFAIPGRSTVRTALCGARDRGDSSALVVGTVRRVDRLDPIQGAIVTAQWYEITFGSKGLVRSTPVARVSTDSSGRFLLCGLPGDAGVQLWATSGRAATGEIHVELPPAGVVPVALAIDPADTLGEASGARHGSARVSGFVRLPGGAPIAGARVRLREADRETVTDDVGHYALVDLPAGTFSLEARAVGFVPIARAVTLSATQPLLFDVRFDSAARILPEVEVRGKVVFDRSMQEFEAAKKRGFGYFLSPEDIERRNAFDAADLLRMVPGVRVVESSFGQSRVVSTRGGCSPTIVVDGMRFDNQTTLDEAVSASDIAAIAVYRSSAETPVEYQGFSGCGAIVVWTKHGPARKGRRR